MGAIRNIDIPLSDKVAAELDGAVASGEYATAGDVVREALDAWSRNRTDADEETARLRHLWNEGIASGMPRTVTPEWFETIKQRGSDRLKALRAED